jgi:hypothetical protein
VGGHERNHDHKQRSICSICQESFDPMSVGQPTVTLSCYHTFHTECIREWQAFNGRPLQACCPLKCAPVTHPEETLPAAPEPDDEAEAEQRRERIRQSRLRAEERRAARRAEEAAPVEAQQQDGLEADLERLLQEEEQAQNQQEAD